MTDLTNRYLWVPGVDHIVADEQVAAEKLYWPLGDHLGTVRDLAVFDEGSPDPGDGLLY